jgi:hypothetical protein
MSAPIVTLGTTSVTLSDDMLWSDEFGWSPIVRSREYSLGGSLIVDQGVSLAGRPITLNSSVDGGWLQREAVESLHALIDSGEVLTLTLRGTNYLVLPAETNAIDATPVVDYADPAGDDWYVVTLRFFEV